VDYIYHELAYCSFKRRLGYPRVLKIDQVKTKHLNGILKITVPALAILKTKKIGIETPEQVEVEAAGAKAAVYKERLQ